MSLKRDASSESDEVSKLVKGVCTEEMDKNLSEMLTSSVQGPEEKKVVQELDSETDAFGKLRSSAAGELAQRKNVFVASRLPEGLEAMVLLCGMVNHFESNLSNRKSFFRFSRSRVSPRENTQNIFERN